MRIFLLNLILVLSIFSCNNESTDSNKKPIARVNENYLYASEIADITNFSTNKQDSITLVREYIKKWITEELKLEKAEKNLTEIQLDVEYILEKYRKRLIINKFEQQIIIQKLDTVVSENEIGKYYDKYSGNFTLENTFIKGLYIKVPKSSPKLYNLLRWYKSSKDDDFDKTKQYCALHADMYEDFNGEWIDINVIKNLVPVKNINLDRKIKQKNYVEIQDSLNLYLLNIDDKRLKGTPSPINIVKNDIKKIIINKRKIQLIRDMEVSNYTDAENNKQIEIY